MKPTSSNTAVFWRALGTSLGLGLLLLGYTLLGAFVFMTLEGGDNDVRESPVPARHISDPPRSPLTLQHNASVWLQRANMASSARVVEKLWEITASLNILYRDNWTRLATAEIASLQEEVIRRVTSLIPPQEQERELEYHSARHEDPGEWRLARAFLYSLSLVTTIGSGDMSPRTPQGKLASILFSLLGIPLALVYVSSAGGALARAVRHVVRRALRPAPPVTFYRSTPIRPETSKKVAAVSVLVAVVVVLLYIAAGVGTLILAWEWPLVDAVYMSVMSMTTVNLGDWVTTSEIATWFCSMYVIFGVTLVAMSVSVVYSTLSHTRGACDLSGRGGFDAPQSITVVQTSRLNNSDLEDAFS